MAEDYLYFPEARLVKTCEIRKYGYAVFSCILPREVREKMGWREPDASDGVIRKLNRLLGTTLELKQSMDEIGRYRIEADIEIKSVEGFRVWRMQGERGRFIDHVQFDVRFEAFDASENLVRFLRKTKKPGQLKINYTVVPVPQQTEIPRDGQMEIRA